MDLENLVAWTRGKLAKLTSGDVPVKSSGSLDTLTRGRAAVPRLDLFESQTDFRLVVDVPGATPGNTHLVWDDFETLSIHVQRGSSATGTPWLSEFEESDWYREVRLSLDADGARAHSTVRDGVLTIRVPKRRTTSSKLIPIYAG